jgi:hypothetical protein
MPLPAPRKPERRFAMWRVLAAFALVSAGLLPAHGGTLEDIRARGVVTCAIEAAQPGISVQEGSGRAGLAPDLCAALAHTVLGRAQAVAFVTVTDADAHAVLQAEEADVLLMALPWTLASEVTQGVMLVQPVLRQPQGRRIFGPVVRQGDDSWFIAVRWVLQALQGRGEDVSSADLSEAAKAAGLEYLPELLARGHALQFKEITARHSAAWQASGFEMVPVPANATWR